MVSRPGYNDTDLSPNGTPQIIRADVGAFSTFTSDESIPTATNENLRAEILVDDAAGFGEFTHYDPTTRTLFVAVENEVKSFVNEGLYWRPSTAFSGAAGNTGKEFGADIDSDGNRLVIGSPGENKVYVYEFNSIDKVWQAKPTLDGSAYGNGRFGSSVAIEGNRLVVGAEEAQLEYYSTVRADTTHEIDLKKTGVVLAFEHDGTNWVQDQVLMPYRSEYPMPEFTSYVYTPPGLSAPVSPGSEESQLDNLWNQVSVKFVFTGYDPSTGLSDLGSTWHHFDIGAHKISCSDLISSSLPTVYCSPLDIKLAPYMEAIVVDSNGEDDNPQTYTDIVNNTDQVVAGEFFRPIYGFFTKPMTLVVGTTKNAAAATGSILSYPTDYSFSPVGYSNGKIIYTGWNDQLAVWTPIPTGDDPPGFGFGGYQLQAGPNSIAIGIDLSGDNTGTVTAVNGAVTVFGDGVNPSSKLDPALILVTSSIPNDQLVLEDYGFLDASMWGASVDIAGDYVYVGAPGEDAVAVYDLSGVESPIAERNWQVSFDGGTSFVAPTLPTFLDDQGDGTGLGTSLAGFSDSRFYAGAHGFKRS